MDRPPFDPFRFACWLLAGVLAVECFVVVAGVAQCVWYSQTIISNPDILCDPKDRLFALLTGALSAALALLAGFNRKE